LKATESYLKKQITDEKKSAKDYRKRGFPQIAKQETKHRKILEAKLKQIQTKKKANKNEKRKH
jgi:rubrerythrin